MSWLSTSISLATAALLAAPAAAQNLERAIMPGELTQAHAKLEENCGNCHVRFDRSRQTELCLDCHKEVAADVRAKAGFHGRLKERQCNLCHTEHKGREAKIVVLDEATFDHRQTDFPLKGRHQALKCASCHAAGRRHAATQSACVACHRKDDPHKATLGTKCESCHAETGWKPARFDHAATRFPLHHRHAEIACARCHADNRFAGTSRECYACHKEVDAHHGRFGTRCASCHTDLGWKTPSFNHDRDTHFPLRERHHLVKCDACHRDAAKPAAVCSSCHARDDPHKGELGAKCESCHSERGWKQPARFDHGRTRFPLLARHRDVKCADCHADATFRERPAMNCQACHQRTDAERGHKGRFGERCETCHEERGWNLPKFDHARDAGYALRGRHASLKCDSCHRGALYQDKPVAQCVACHGDEHDPHQGQLGRDCAGCHGEATWRETRFDHGRSAFPLAGEHAKVACKECHASKAFKDAKAECVTCHEKTDYHKGRLGTDCARCHNPAGWKDARFDHSRTAFPLVQKHAALSCTACHDKRVTTVSAPTACYACHRRDDIHFETNGTRCEQCHEPTEWKKPINQEGRKAAPEPAAPFAPRRRR